MQTVAKPTLPSVSERSSTTEVYTTHQEVLHLAARESVVYRGTSSAHGTTLNPLRGKCGQANLATIWENGTKMVRWGSRLPRLVIWAGCSFEEKACVWT